jgi:predicted RNA-binding Zn-ribbon protein involved in translation (DUF1610 family)
MTPRAFDSDEVARDEHPGLLRFTENVDCPQCGQVFEGQFHDPSLTVQDITDPPAGRHECPNCGHRFTSELTGWTMYNEAG